MASSGKYTWRITDYSGRKSESLIYSDVFTLGGCNWRIWVDHPNGLSNVEWLSVYLAADDVGLPREWCIYAKFSLTLVNQLQSHNSITYKIDHEFKEPGSSNWGWKSFKRMSEIDDSINGYLVNDTLIVEAGVKVLNVSPPTLLLETSLRNLGKFITDHAGQCKNFAGSSSNGGLKSEVPSLKEVEIAKQSLKECLTDLFRLSIKDKLATSLETLSRAKIGLSSDEQRAVEVFWGDFDDFVGSFLKFEQENNEFEQHKLARDQMLCSVTKYHGTFLSNKQRLDDLTKEEEEHRKKMEEASKCMEEAKSKKTKLISDWQNLIMESEETKSEYMAQEKKVEEARERKKIAEERLSNCTTAWSSLKTTFC